MSDTRLPWTPGPWSMSKQGGFVTDQTNTLIVIDGISQPHGYVPPDDVSRHNARLISAAPELFEALEAFYLAAKMDRALNPAWKVIYDAAADALAKAKGTA